VSFACVLLAQRAELAHRLGRPHQLGEEKREIERPARAEARVARRLVAVRELLLEHRAGGPAEAFGHVLSRVLDVDAAGPGAFPAAGVRRVQPAPRGGSMALRSFQQESTVTDTASTVSGALSLGPGQCILIGKLYLSPQAGSPPGEISVMCELHKD